MGRGKRRIKLLFPICFQESRCTMIVSRKCKRSYVRREKWRRRRWTNTIAAKLTAVTKARMSKPLKNGRRRKRISKKQRKKRERRKKKKRGRIEKKERGRKEKKGKRRIKLLFPICFQESRCTMIVSR